MLARQPYVARLWLGREWKCGDDRERPIMLVPIIQCSSQCLQIPTCSRWCLASSISFAILRRDVGRSLVAPPGAKVADVVAAVLRGVRIREMLAAVDVQDFCD